MVRLDKFLCDCGIGTRSQVKEYIRSGQVSVNGNVMKKSDCKIHENEDKVCFQSEPVNYRKYAYYMLYKPEGFLSATEDQNEKTVLDLLKSIRDKNLFPVGRLDKDTTGLLLITNDGELSHNLLSPRKHVEKTYLAGIDHPLSEEDIIQLEQGLDIGDEKKTLPSKVTVPDSESGDSCHILLTITEGRYHQVKRMLQAVNNRVISLKRISFGPLQLDETLSPGEFRELTVEETSLLKKRSVD